MLTSIKATCVVIIITFEEHSSSEEQETFVIQMKTIYFLILLSLASTTGHQNDFNAEKTGEDFQQYVFKNIVY